VIKLADPNLISVNNTYRNKKNGKLYYKLGIAIDATNSRDGEKVIIYSDMSKVYVREEKEFHEKFDKMEF
jgi:hypothetical protein